LSRKNLELQTKTKEDTCFSFF